MRTLFMLILSLFLIGALVQTSEAQITIQTNDFLPAVGSTVSFPQAIGVTEAFYDSAAAGSGGGHVWDFSSYTFTSPTSQTVVNALTAPRVDTFPSANLVLQFAFGNDTSWNYYQSVPSSFTQLGSVTRISGLGDNFSVYDDATPEYVFPMQFNDSWQATRSRTLISTPDIYTVTHDTTSYVVDAYGTATYNGNSVPCLRVASLLESTMITYFMGSPFSSEVRTTETVEFVAVGFDLLMAIGRATTSGFVNYFGSASSSFVNVSTDIVEPDPGTLPDGFGLAQNYPNPFNPTTDIQFSVPQVSDVRLIVYNVLGQQAKVLVNQQLPAGSYTVDWDGTDQSGNTVASGIYFYRLETGDFTASKKMLLLK